MGGGGSSDNYEATQAKQEAKRQQARDALNVYFGVQPTGGAPSKDAFTKNVDFALYTGGGDGGFDTVQRSVFNEDAYNDAVKAWEASKVSADQNKADREGLYTTVRGDAFTAGKRGLDETKTTADRNNKFALFAQGLNGGSEDIDQSALLGRVYSKGLLDLGSKADSAKADLQGSDEAARLGLLQSIDAGMDQGSALSSALAQMKNNSDKAAATAAGIDLGDLFANSGALYTKSQAAQGQNAAKQYWANYFATSPKSYSGGSGGIVTSTGGP